MPKAITAEDVEAAAIPLRKGLERLSNLIKPELPDELLAPIFALTKKLGGINAKIEEGIKVRVKTLVVDSGKVFSEAGSRALDLAGWRLEVRPTGGGYDEDRLAALLKGKGIKRSEYKDVEEVWTLNKDKLQQLIGAKKVKQSELDSCLKPTGYSVQTPTQIEEESND